MSQDIHLNGGEIGLLKTLGLSGSSVSGKMLVDRMGEQETAEFLDTLNGLLSLGYVLSNKVNVRSMEDVERASFRTNPQYASELRDAFSPARRRAREQRDQRRRRRG